MNRRELCLAGSALVSLAPRAWARSQAPADPTGLPLVELRAALRAGRLSARDLAGAYLGRIRRLDRNGPRLQSLIRLNPDALAQAGRLDQRRHAGLAARPLEGIPLVVKDNIETEGPMPTTAGSLALAANVTGRDSAVVARLRAAGAIVLAKANLSEWANMRSTQPISGWSALGGLTRNPYATDRSAQGSSSGPAAAAAAGLCAGAIGTETDGSIVNPAAVNGVVGIKPTLGLVSRRGIVPITHRQDTAGPLARTVADAALLLTVMAGSDPADPATAEADGGKQDYLKALDPQALKGARLGLMRFVIPYDRRTEAVLAEAVQTLKAAGAEVVEVRVSTSPAELGRNEFLATITEMKADLNAYLAQTPRAVAVRSIADLIAFNAAHAAQEEPFFGQERLEQIQAAKDLSDPDYLKARETAHRLAGPEGLDRLLADNRLDALIGATTSPAAQVDLLAADRVGGPNVAEMPAVAGYPHVTVPMGQVRGLPVGLSLIGPAWSEARLIGLAYAFEQRTHARRPPTFLRFAELPQEAAHVAPVR